MYFSCSLSAITLGDTIKFNVTFNDGGFQEYSLSHSSVMNHIYYNYTSTGLYDVSAIIKNPNISLGAVSIINGTFLFIQSF